MHYLRLPQALLTALALYTCSGVIAAPVHGSDHALERRAPIKLYHITSAAIAETIKTTGVKLTLKSTHPGSDFNPVGAGGFYTADNLKELIAWCNSRHGGSAKVNCAAVVSFDFNPAGLKIHTFKGPGGPADQQQFDWMDSDDFDQWSEFIQICTHGAQSDTSIKLSGDLANGGKALDVVVGPMGDLTNKPLKQYAFRTAKAIANLKNPQVAAAGK